MPASIQFNGTGRALAWANSFDAWFWVAVCRDTSSTPGDTFSEIVRIGKFSRQIENVIDVEDDSPFDADSCEIVDFCVDFNGYLFVLVAGEDSSTPKMDLMKYHPTGLLIYSAYDDGQTALSLRSCRVEVDPDGRVGVFTSADETDSPDYPMYVQIMVQA